MSMQSKLIDFLDSLALQGKNQFSLYELKLLLPTIAAKNEIMPYIKYLFETGLLLNIRGEIWEINHELLVKMRDNPLAFLKYDVYARKWKDTPETKV